MDLVAEADGIAVGPPRKKVAKPFGWEIMYREERRGLRRSRFNDWHRGWAWYATAAQRDRAVTTLNRKDTLFQYRPVER